ncbi:SAM-dependent methyltransferase [Microbispora sp. CA-135349]|uniref:SAM-dependent methyltransferase n=1 Tax=Microbispora sp. CA-135349 TaxID=3239953 RepID=UPI003D8CF1AF
MTEYGEVPQGVDPNTPSIARMYDYFLGGKDNFKADREAAKKMISLVPNVREFARANREFLGRIVRFLAQQGIDQFLDVGAGLPTQQNVHQVAQAVAPQARVAYVDNDPIVLVHGRALLADSPGTIVVQGDINAPEAILGDADLRAHLDLSRPIAVLMLSVLNVVPDDAKAEAIVATFRAAMAPGSYLVISHGYTGQVGSRTDREVREVYRRSSAGSSKPRDHAQIAAYFDGLELLEPGIVPVAAWRPEQEWEAEVDLSRPNILAAVGRVP